jgi:carboxymethylenebutenolidase
MAEENYVTLSVSGNLKMQAYTSLPFANKGTFPGLIVFQEAFGVNGHIRNLTERFAEQGYLVIAPELFHRSAPIGFEASYTDFPSIMPHMQALTEEGLLEDVRASWDWLENHPQIQKGNIACIGYCMGGRTSFLSNSALPFKAAISYYGGRILPDLIKKAPDLHGPMLFFWGGLDKNIPHTDVETITGELRKENKVFTNVEISNAEHGFFCDERASYNSQAASEAWALTLAFLKEKLKV